MDAVAELDQLFAKDSWQAEDVRQLKQVLASMKEPNRRFREAVYRIASAQAEPTGAAAVKLGVARYMLCQFNEAVSLFSAGTDNKERRFFQGRCHKYLRQYQAALDNLERAKDKGWDEREVQLELAEVHCLAGQLDAAGKIVDRLAKTDDASYRYVAGLLAEMRGDYTAAVEHYETARRQVPRHPAATFRLAYFYDLHGDETLAMDLYRECLSRPEQGSSPESSAVYANALLNMSVLFEDAGQYGEATRCLRRLLAANPNHARARLFLKDVQSSKTMRFDEDEAKRIARRNDLLSIPITDFELSVRARNCLKKMNIRTLGDLLHVTELDLLSYKNFGETSLSEIKTVLASKNLRLGQLREEGEAVLAEPTEQPAPATVGNEGVLATPLSQIEFSVRARKALERLGVKTLGELATKTEPELLACRNFGQTSLNEVQQRLAEYGMRLREA